MISNLRYVVALLFSTIFIIGCQDKEPITTPNIEPEPVIIDFAFNVEGALESGEPFANSKATSKDIIAVQLYSIDQKGVQTAVAYGMFDSYNSIEPIELITGVKYMVEVTCLKDGQNIVAQRSDGGGYYSPFLLSTYSNNSTTITNAFKYSNIYFRGLSRGDTEYPDGSSRELFRHPFVERYCGYSKEFTASEDLPSVEIEMRRVYATMRFTCSNLNEGSVKLLIEGAPELTFDATNNGLERDVNISLSGTELGDKSWIADEYSENLTYDLVHVSTSGVESLLTEDGDLTIYRNKIHPASIKVNISSGVSFDVEQGEMEIEPEVEL